MRAPPLAILLSIVGSAVSAQPANEVVKSLESCFQSARAADSICSDPAYDAVKRLDCLQRARAAQLECLDHVPPGMSAGSPPNTSPAGVSPDLPAGAVPPEQPTGSISPNPSELPNEAPSKPTEAVAPDTAVGTAPPEQPPKAIDSPTQQASSNWVVSETTSPLDYSSLVTALIRSPSNAKDAPNALAFRCRGQRTELFVRTQGSWRASPTNALQVDYQIDDQPFVRLQWTASADGKTASYKDDAVGLLRSLPEAARLKISVFDWQGPGHETTFDLAGLNVVRKKIELVCKLVDRTPGREARSPQAKP
jgi:hypothetical protein